MNKLKKFLCLLVAALILSGCSTQTTNSETSTKEVVTTENSYNPPKYYDEYAISKDVMDAQNDIIVTVMDSDTVSDGNLTVKIAHKDYTEVITYYNDTDPDKVYALYYVSLTENSRIKRWQDALQFNKVLPKHTLLYNTISLDNTKPVSVGAFVAHLSEVSKFNSYADVEAFLKPYVNSSMDIDMLKSELLWRDDLTEPDIFRLVYNDIITDDYYASSELLEAVDSVDGQISVHYYDGNAYYTDDFTKYGDYGVSSAVLIVKNNSDIPFKLNSRLLVLYRDIPFEANESNWGAPLDFDYTIELPYVAYTVTGDTLTSAMDLEIPPDEKRKIVVYYATDREGVYRVCFRGVPKGQFHWTEGVSEDYMGTSVADYVLPEFNCGKLLSYTSAIQTPVTDIYTECN